jgi:hypothetical protein
LKTNPPPFVQVDSGVLAINAKNDISDIMCLIDVRGCDDQWLWQ